MQSLTFNETIVEEACVSILEALGYEIAFGPDVTGDSVLAIRTLPSETILVNRLTASLFKLNPSIPSEAIEEAIRKVTIPQSPSLIANNRAFHRMLVDGVEVEYRRKDGSIAGDRVWLVDFDNPQANDWLAVNQFTV